MAEMNELLEQAIRECEGLAAEAESFGHALSAQDGTVSDSEREVLERSRHSLDDLQAELAALRQRDAQMDAHEERTRQELAETDEAIDDAERAAREALEHARQGLQELRAERERISEALHSAQDRLREQLDAFGQRLDRCEERAGERLDQAEDAAAELESAMHAAQERLQDLAAELVRQKAHAISRVVEMLEDTAAAHAEVEERLETGIAGLLDGLQGEGRQVLDQLHEVFDESLPQTLGEGVSEVAARMGDLSAVADAGGEATQAALQEGLQAFSNMYGMLSSMMKLMHDMQMSAIRSLR